MRSQVGQASGKNRLNLLLSDLKINDSRDPISEKKTMSSEQLDDMLLDSLPEKELSCSSSSQDTNNEDLGRCRSLFSKMFSIEEVNNKFEGDSGQRRSTVLSENI
jgi:hypothetical protein